MWKASGIVIEEVKSSGRSYDIDKQLLTRAYVNLAGSLISVRELSIGMTGLIPPVDLKLVWRKVVKAAREYQTDRQVIGPYATCIPHLWNRTTVS